MSQTKPIKRPPVVEVEWVDSMGYTGWAPCVDRIASFDKTEDLDHVSVGFLLKRTRVYVALGQSTGRIGSVDNCIQIPRSAVRNITILRK